ncbi:MAG: T9SS type A sorting domain-containing protein [Candidatus Marinimicrobia bacterium]|nr:T9SS type A sorting domain-containing protein [Candidatus Neomarinimicrobiota bacterium]
MYHIAITVLIIFNLIILPVHGNSQTKAIFSETSLTLEQDGTVYLTIDSPEQIGGIQFSLEYDTNKLSLGKPVISESNQHFTIYSGMDSNLINVVAFSLEGGELDLSSPVLMIPLSAKGEYLGSTELMVKDFILSSPGGNKINLKITAGEIFILPELPKKFKLTQNYPNPFNSETVIRYDLPEDAIIKLSIYNVLGQKIRVLEDGIMSAGFHAAVWDGKDENGKPLSSGEYIFSLKVGVNAHSMKMVLLR